MRPHVFGFLVLDIIFYKFLYLILLCGLVKGSLGGVKSLRVVTVPTSLGYGYCYSRKDIACILYAVSLSNDGERDERCVLAKRACEVALCTSGQSLRVYLTRGEREVIRWAIVKYKVNVFDIYNE